MKKSKYTQLLITDVAIIDDFNFDNTKKYVPIYLIQPVLVDYYEITSLALLCLNMLTLNC